MLCFTFCTSLTKNELLCHNTYYENGIGVLDKRKQILAQITLECPTRATGTLGTEPRTPPQAARYFGFFCITTLLSATRIWIRWLHSPNCRRWAIRPFWVLKTICHSLFQDARPLEHPKYIWEKILSDIETF
jgi:hypothetical protein